MSRFEGRPNTVLEAVSCGCPVVVSDIAAHREILDEESAVFAPTESPSQIAEAISGVLGRPDLARQRAVRATARNTPKSVTEVAYAYREVYRSIVSVRSANS